MLIDVHAHFLHDRTPRGDWRERNASRLRAGDRIGITTHVASILGSWGHTSPTYFPSLTDLRYGNDAMLALQRQHAGRIRGYVTVNPNYPTEALEEITRCLDAGMIGIKLAASRRANDPLVDPICRAAAERRVPILHHVWQSRRGEYAGQEASDAWELGELARRPPDASSSCSRTSEAAATGSRVCRAIRGLSNVMVDLSGSGVDGGMLEACLEAVGVQRLLWGCDLTMETGWAKLRHLEYLLDPPQLELVRWGNAVRIFPSGAFPSD